jgi:hypothetical protein
MFHSTQGGGGCGVLLTHLVVNVGFFFFFDRIIDGDVLIPPN